MYEMDIEKTLLEEAEEEVCDLTRDEREFFLYQQKFNGLLFGKTENLPSTDLPVIRAKCLSWLLSKLVGKRFDLSLIVDIQGVHIQGNVTCDHIVFTKSLYLTGCYFSDEVGLFQCTFSNLLFQKVRFDKKIKAEGICVKNNFFIKQSRFQGTLDIQKGHIGGMLGVTGSLFLEPEEAINANAIRIDGNVYLLSQLVENEERKFDGFVKSPFFWNIFSQLSELSLALFYLMTFYEIIKFQVNGAVRFEGSKIKGFFECHKGLFNAPEKLALSLAGSRIDGYVSLINCGVIGIVSLNSARIGASITIENSRCLFSDRLFESLKEDEKDNYQGISLNIDDVQVDGHINIRYCVINEIVLLRCAQIGGHLDFSGSRFSSNFGPTLNADNIQVGGNITATDFKSAGSISLLDARIEGILNWQQGTEICYKKGVAFQADRIQSRGIYLRNGFKTDGEISIPGAIIEGSLICTGGKFFDIYAKNISVKGDVCLDAQSSNPNNYFQSVGKVSLCNADINGSLRCSGGEFVDIDAENISISGDACLTYGFKASYVLLTNSKIDGSLKCTEGELVDLVADNMSVKGDVYLNHGFNSVGHVLLKGSEINGSLKCSEGEFCYLLAPEVSVRGSVLLNHYFICSGSVLLDNAQIAGTLDCFNGVFSNPEPDSVAIAAEHLLVNNIYLDCLCVDGRLNFYGAEVKNTFRNRNIIIPNIYRKTKWESGGGVCIDHVSAKNFLLDWDAWPAQKNLSVLGFAYQHIEIQKEGVRVYDFEVKNAFKWLDLIPKKSFHPQPYEQLASVLKKSGLEKEAQKIQIKKNKLLDRKEKQKLIEMLEAEKKCDSCELSRETLRAGCEILRHPKPQIFKACSDLWDCVCYLLKLLFMRVAIGYGYRVERLLKIFVFLFLSSSILFHWGYSDDPKQQEQNIMTHIERVQLYEV
ncbi:MAG: hypothetical protein D3903_02430 [Candidatus Electrothrix sp. GM3_4]|nr:hypothetical protein [Candidatus Electrothrix sp. GM3_4]